MLTPIYDHAIDKNVATYILYGNSSDNKLYYDLTLETPLQVSQEDLEHAFKKGRALISVTDGGTTTLYTVVSVTANVAKVVATVSNAVALVEYAAKASS